MTENWVNLSDAAQKISDKYDPELELQAREWIETILNEKLVGATFQESLKDGVVLCRVSNVVVPSANIKINNSKMPFKQMENISNYLSCLDTINVPKHDQFQTIDLFEGKNMGAVVTSIFALSRHAQKMGYKGQTIGPKLADKQEISFSNEQINQAKNTPSQQMGFNKGANASGVVFGARRDIAPK